MIGNWIGEDGSPSQDLDMSGFFHLFAGLSATVITFTYSANILGQWIGEISLNLNIPPSGQQYHPDHPPC